MTRQEQNTITVPGVSYSVATGTMPQAVDEANIAAAANVTNFEGMAHLLSDKPLRRPKRTRPLPESKKQ